MGLLSSIKKIGTNVLDTAAGVFQNPITAVTKGVTAAKQEFLTSTKTERVAKTALTTAVLGGSILAAGTTAGKAAVATVAKALTPTTTKGKVIAAAAAIPIAAAITKEPIAAAKTAVKIPVELAKFGGDIASFAVSPSIETGKQIISESPLISSAIGAGVALAAAPIITPIISGALTRETIEEGTQEITQAIQSQEQMAITSPIETAAATTLPAAAATTPITPETQPLIATAGSASKKAYKTRTKQKIPSMNQRVNILVNNRATAKYINKRSYPF